MFIIFWDKANASSTTYKNSVELSLSQKILLGSILGKGFVEASLKNYLKWLSFKIELL